MLHGRKTLVAALSGITCLAFFISAPQPAGAEPDINKVSKKVDDLLHEAERAQERFNLARVDKKALARELKALRSDEAAQNDEVEALRKELAQSIVDRYQGSSISNIGQVVVSDDPEQFLEELATLSTYRGMQDETYDNYLTELKTLNMRRDATAERFAEVSDLEKKLAAEKKIVDEKYAEAKAILDKLKAKERDKILGGDQVPTPTNVPASGRAKAAVDFAMAQIGDPYVYGAAGPNAWDCSGLTMMAWKAAGVGLPHSSAAQIGYGQRVSTDQLQAGDLVFYYSPISHVGMYIGNGQIVHAPHPGSTVQVTGLHSMPFVGATRPG